MEIVQLIKCLHEQCLDLSVDIKFKKQNVYELTLVLLNGSLIEYTGSLVLLIDNGYTVSIPNIFRSILETYVDLKNLYIDKTYIFQLEANHEDAWKELFQNAKGNPYLRVFAEDKNYENNCKKFKAKLDFLAKKGYKPLTIKDRFKKADMKNEYDSLYNQLSCEAHNNIRALRDRHLKVDENHFMVFYYKDRPLQNFLSYLDYTAVCLINASNWLHNFFKTGHSEKFVEFNSKLNDIRSRYQIS